jgi:hypothetical protein
MSASLNWIAWNFEIAWPNWCRSLRVLQRFVEGAHRPADRERGDRDPAAVEDGQELLEALAARPEQILLGHGASVNDSSRVSEARQPIFRYFLARVKPGRVLGHDQVRDLGPAPLRRCRSRP